jgi:PAS domain S-box-containing protein
MKSIAARFLLPAGAFLTLMSGFVLYRAHVGTRAHVDELMDQQAALALEFDLAVRAYIAQEVRPRMEALTDTDAFVPETMSTSFVARSVFERVRQRFPDYIIKFSSDDPRNPANLATPGELEVIRYFNEHPEQDKWTGTIALDGLQYHAVFRARRMRAECLRCHGAPEDAPASLVERFGTKAGFHRPLGEVIALDTIAIPVDTAQAALAQRTWKEAALVVAGLLTSLGVIILLFRLAVTRRLRAMQAHFQRIATAPERVDVAPIPAEGNDEISGLARSFNDLAKRLRAAYSGLESRVCERTADLTEANLALLHEVGERKRAEQALRTSEERYRLLADHATDMISRHDENGVFTYVSPACEALLGYAPRELLGQSIFDVMHTEDRGTMRGEWDMVLHDVGNRATTYRLRRKNDAHVWFETSARAIGPSAEGVTEVICVSRDVTERRHMQEAQRAHVNFLQTLLDTIPSAIFSKDIEGRYLSGNHAWFEWMNLPRERLLRRTAHDLFPPDLAETYTQKDRELFEKPGKQVYEGVLEQTNGARRPVLFHKATYTDETGAVAGLVGVITDITEQKRTEQHLHEAIEQMVAALDREKKVAEQLAVARERAEDATRAKTEFLANMSHEIRTPMTAITGFAELLAEEVACCTECASHTVCDLRTRNQQHVQTIVANSRHLLEIINDILDLSKIEAGKLVIERVRFSPMQLVAEVHTLMSSRASEKGLAFHADFENAIPETIESDPTRLRQILINLVGNAIKFTADGEVRVSVRYHADPETPHLQFDVTDTGIGLGPEQLEGLFEPFTQADTSTTRRFGGTGLGLAICRRLAQRLGGEIQVSSTPGRGSTFSTTVATGALGETKRIGPACGLARAPGQEAQAAPAAAALAAHRVLLAEDGPDNQRLIKALLRKAGAEVTLADNGNIALDLALAAHANGQPFDVILMDMQMPVLDGYEATRRLRAADYGGVIIALTAHAMDGDRERCLEAGCDAYATKPVNRDQLIGVIREHTGGQTVDARAME